MTRLMCSKDRTEVEFVRKELFRAGIRAEIRSNPVAAALRVSRLELWVQDERDFVTATKVFDALQSGNGNRPVVEAPVALPPAELETSVEVSSPEFPPIADADPEEDRLVEHSQEAPQDTPASIDPAIEEAGAWLEKEIQELLERESKMTEECANFQQQVSALKESLMLSQAQLTKETESRVAAEAKLNEFSGMRASLENELAQRTRAEEQLHRQLADFKAQIRPREEALAAAQAKLEAKNREMQSQQSMLSKLHSEMASREAQTEKLRESLAQLRMELGQERERRIGAEEKADKLASRQTALEEQLVHHTRLHQELQRELQEEQKQLRGYAGTLNNLRQKLQTSRASRPDTERPLH